MITKRLPARLAPSRSSARSRKLSRNHGSLKSPSSVRIGSARAAMVPLRKARRSSMAASGSPGKGKMSITPRAYSRGPTRPFIFQPAAIIHHARRCCGAEQGAMKRYHAGGALLAALIAACAAVARAGELADFNAAVETFSAHNRVAIGYLRAGNRDLAAVELERLRAAW